jgi:multicomponent Na+:H+ antiporter subunit E
VRHAISLVFVLAAVWIAWSGIFKPLLLGLGLFSVLAVVLLTRRMGSIDDETVPYRITLRALLYAPWLLKEIVLANLDVARRILGPGPAIHPRLIRVHASQTTDLTRTVYANSITLTPGTVTVEIEGSELTVHALTPEAAEGLETGEMDRRVTRIEGRA